MYNNLNIRHFATRRGKKFLSLVVFVCLYLCSFSQAKLLNPDGTQWTANGKYNCAYLKPRFSYLCGDGNSAGMVKFLRTTNAIGSTVTSDPSQYYRRTCLSVSYDKDWVTNLPAGDVTDIVSEFPTIVYAYSVPHEEDVYEYGGAKYTRSQCYDVYWYTPDDSYPIITGNCFNLFQNGNSGKGSMLEDVSGINGWNFTGVTSTEQMFSMCRKLLSVNFGSTVNLTNVTTIKNMFNDCKSLDTADFRVFVNSLVLDTSKIKTTGCYDNVVAGNGKLHNKTYSTANAIVYQTSGNGSFVYKDGPDISMIIRNLGAEQVSNDINFHWDIVNENGIEKFTVQYFDNDNWVDAFSVDGNGEQVVSLYSETWDEVPSGWSGEKRFRVKQISTDSEIDPAYTDEFMLSYSFLPIELSYFIVSQDGENILFEWETETETNNDYFTIEQSIDGVRFCEVARIAGAGTTSASNYYEYSLPVSFAGMAYFRLKQTDYNGDYSYSDVQTIYIGNSEYIRLYPTIATDFITIEGDYESVKFSDAQGKIHHPTRMHGNSYPIAALPQGMHYAIISLKNGEIVTRQFFRK